ncbi:MAG: TolC family protein [Epsilonproteobacteria bacterium]|nr:hypothetical protein [Campylobacterota bacterium]NPA57343.1 TolC family protein [Campylobacterota bacterium]
MRALSLLLTLTLSLTAGEILSTLQERELSLEAQKAEREADKLATSWINPIRASYLYQKGDQFPNQHLESFTISLNQPIFKSFGIWEAIKYARAKRGESLAGVELHRNSLMAQLYLLAFQLKRLKLQRERENLALKNARIDLLVKREEYLKGELDSTFLDNAILKKNRISLSLLSIEDGIVEREEAIRDLTDLEPEEIELPHLTLMDRELFLKGHLELAQARAAKKGRRHLKRMAVSRHLPSLSLLYSYNYQKVQGSQFSPNFSYSDHFSTYGISITMPLWDINTRKNIELAQLDYLKADLLLAQRRRSLSNLYSKVERELKVVERKMELTREDIELYRSLLEETRELYEAGEKTIYDLKTMENSLKQREIDLQIFQVDRQLLLLQLYKGLKNAF